MLRTLASGTMALLCVPLVASAAWKAHPAALQKIYQDRVPHTDRTGKPIEQFDAERSFFPLVLYHALQGEQQGIRYELKDDAAAGFNACMPYEGQDPRALAEAAERARVQLILHRPADDVVKALSGNPAVLAWYLDEEPSGNFQGKDSEAHLVAFVRRREQIRAIDPNHPVFPLDIPALVGPAGELWAKWNSAGDVSSHDNYPINQHHPSLSFDYGIPETVTKAVKAVHEGKPVWVCLQAFEGLSPTWQFSMPSTRATALHGLHGDRARRDGDHVLRARLAGNAHRLSGGHVARAASQLRAGTGGDGRPVANVPRAVGRRRGD